MECSAEFRQMKPSDLIMVGSIFLLAGQEKNGGPMISSGVAEENPDN